MENEKTIMITKMIDDDISNIRYYCGICWKNKIKHFELNIYNLVNHLLKEHEIDITF